MEGIGSTKSSALFLGLSSLCVGVDAVHLDHWWALGQVGSYNDLGGL
jgi:hypothetical protein